MQVTLDNRMDHSAMDHVDHSAMSHAGMDHSKMGHSMPDMPGMDDEMCSMNMLFTWDYKHMCVVFKWWHVRSLLDLILTMIAIVALSSGYEYVRYRMRLLDAKSLTSCENVGRTKAKKALGYALLVAYSYILMLVFMTYNGWAMLSVAVGAGLGYYRWGQESARTMACH